MIFILYFISKSIPNTDQQMLEIGSFNINPSYSIHKAILSPNSNEDNIATEETNNAKVNNPPEYYNSSTGDTSPIVYVHSAVNQKHWLAFALTLGISLSIGLISVMLIFYFACRHQTKVITIIQNGNQEIIQHDGVVVETKIRKDVPTPRAKTPKVVRKHRIVRNNSNVSMDSRRITKMNSFVRKFAFGDQ